MKHQSCWLMAEAAAHMPGMKEQGLQALKTATGQAQGPRHGHQDCGGVGGDPKQTWAAAGAAMLMMGVTIE